MARDWEGMPGTNGMGSVNKGFKEIQCENALKSINTNYGKMMEEVPNYQKSSIELMCENWISVKGAGRIKEIVTNLNRLVSGITSEMSKLFNYVNEQAEIIADDSDGIAYNPVAFKSSSDRFSSANAKTDAENSNTAQWNEDATASGINKLKDFIETVTTQMGEISGDIDEIEDAFGYSEQSSSIQGRIATVNEGVTSLIAAIKKFLDPLEAEYRTEASEHNSNVQAMANKEYAEAETANFEYVSGSE